MKTRLWIAPFLIAAGAALASPAAAKPNCSSEMSGVQGDLVVITEDGRYCEASSEDRTTYEKRFVAPPVSAAPVSQGGQMAARQSVRGGNVVTNGCVSVSGDTRTCLNTRFDFSKAAQHVRPVMVGMF